jgi:small-conductance mechanosensitive channel
MNNLLEGINATFTALFQYLLKESNNELTTFISLTVILLILIVAQQKIRSAVDTHDYARERYFLFLIDLIFPIIFLVFVLYIAPLFLTGTFSLILFKSVGYLYIAFFFIRNLIKLGSFQYIPWGLLIYVLSIFSVFANLVLNVNSAFSNNTETHEFFLIVLKISLILLFYIFFFRGIRYLAGFISEKRALAHRIIENLVPFISVLFLVVSVLWLLRIIHISSNIFTGLVLCTIIILVYAFLRAYCTARLATKIFYQRESYVELLDKLRLMLKLLLIFGLYKVFLNFFNFGYFVNYLESFFILKTDLVKVSFFSAISSVFLFLILFSLIGIFKNLTFLSYIKRGKEVEAGTIRAIISNLGLLLVAIISLSQLGLNWKVLIPFAGALGIGIGFGLQTIMNNYISGFILLFSKKLKVGDVIEIEGNAGRAIGNTLQTIYGRVESIDVLSTVVQTTDNIEIVIPNSQFIEGQIVNYSLSDSDIRLRIPFGVSYASDPDQIKELLLKVSKDHPQILSNPEPNVWFKEMGDSALVFYLLCWINIRMLWRLNPLISEIYFKGWYELKEAGVEIPFPQRDMWFKNKVKVEIEK